MKKLLLLTLPLLLCSCSNNNENQPLYYRSLNNGEVLYVQTPQGYNSYAKDEKAVNSTYSRVTFTVYCQYMEVEYVASSRVYTNIFSPNSLWYIKN